MAKKKNENTLQYLQMPLPSGRKYSKMTKVAFGGLNKRYTLDSGDLSMESNISTKEYPYITPSEGHDLEVWNAYNYDDYSQKKPISMHAFDDFFIVIYRDNGAIKIDYYDADGNVYTGIIKSSGATYKDDNIPRSVVQFNVYDTPTDPVSGQFIKKLLIFPDKASMFMKIEKATSNPSGWSDKQKNAAKTDVLYCYGTGANKYYYTVNVVENKDDDGNVTSYTREVKQNGSAGNFICDGMDVLVKTYTNDEPPYLPPSQASRKYYYKNLSQAARDDDTLYGSAIYRWVDDEMDSENSGWKISIPPTMPDIKYATVHLSRVFGVDDDRVYASGYNDYTNWNLDTVDEYNEANSWCSPSQSNTKAGGTFTGITTFQNHVICFKRDFMHEIYNTKNPFRLQDIYAEGAIDNRTIQDVDGKLIFVSEDDVKIYTGSNPRIIGYNLNMPRYEYAVSGTDNRNYYLYCEDADENKHLYVYDTYTDLWSERVIADRVLSFAHNKNGMYMLCRSVLRGAGANGEDWEYGLIFKLDTDDYNHSWSFETDLITNKTVNIKHIKKLQMLVDVAENANLKVYILYDDKEFDPNTSHLVYTSKKAGQYPIRVKPRKTANYGFKLHLEGYGYVKLYELEIFVEAGGDLYV